MQTQGQPQTTHKEPWGQKVPRSSPKQGWEGQAPALIHPWMWAAQKGMWTWARWLSAAEHPWRAWELTSVTNSLPAAGSVSPSLNRAWGETSPCQPQGPYKVVVKKATITTKNRLAWIQILVSSLINGLTLNWWLSFLRATGKRLTEVMSLGVQVNKGGHGQREKGWRQ